MIVIQDLRFQYPGSPFELRIASARVQAGESVALVGASGSGKTTLLHMMAGIIPPPRGAVRVGDRDIGAMTDVQRRSFRISHVGLVFQDFELLDYLTAMENIRLPYWLNPVLSWSPEAQRRIGLLAEQMGLTGLLHRNVEQLSQGERQRVAVCRALGPQPKLVLADEPTGNLDPDNKTKIMTLLREAAVAQQAALIVATHDHELLDHFDAVWRLPTLGGETPSQPEEPHA